MSLYLPNISMIHTISKDEYDAHVDKEARVFLSRINDVWAAKTDDLTGTRVELEWHPNVRVTARQTDHQVSVHITMVDHHDAAGYDDDRRETRWNASEIWSPAASLALTCHELMMRVMGELWRFAPEEAGRVAQMMDSQILDHLTKLRKHSSQWKGDKDGRANQG